jgi:hypothetical protein
MLQIVDSNFYFFIKNADTAQVLDSRTRSNPDGLCITWNQTFAFLIKYIINTGEEDLQGLLTDCVAHEHPPY